MNPKKKRSKAKNRKSSSARRVVRHRNTAAVAHKKRRVYRKASVSPLRRRSNRTVVINRRHRRSNPGSSLMPNLSGLGMEVLYLAGGGITARSVPQLLVPSYNTSWIGYAMNLVTTVVTAGLIGKWKGPAASRPWMLGGLAFTISRAIDDIAGVSILSFAQYSPPFTLSGDATYGMRGIYATYNFALPSNSLSPMQPRALPAAASAAPAAAAAASAASAASAPSPTGVGWANSSFN